MRQVNVVPNTLLLAGAVPAILPACSCGGKQEVARGRLQLLASVRDGAHRARTAASSRRSSAGRGSRSGGRAWGVCGSIQRHDERFGAAGRAITDAGEADRKVQRGADRSRAGIPAVAETDGTQVGFARAAGNRTTAGPAMETLQSTKNAGEETRGRGRAIEGETRVVRLTWLIDPVRRFAATARRLERATRASVGGSHRG